MSVFIISGDINLKRAISTRHYSKKYIFYALFINGQKCQLKEMELMLFSLELRSPLHNHHVANTSLWEIITLMKIKYNLKFTFSFTHLSQVWTKPEVGFLLAFQSLWLPLVSFFLFFYTSSISGFHIGFKLRIPTVNTAFLMPSDTCWIFDNENQNSRSAAQVICTCSCLDKSPPDHC